MDMDEDPLQPSIESVPASGFDLSFNQHGPHSFCGPNALAGAGCPNCDRPLMRMVTLDASDTRLELSALGVARVPLLFCWQCNIAQDVTQYRLRRDGGIELLRFKRGTQGSGFPYEGYPASFPEAQFDLVPVPSKRPDAPRHQVGGQPFTTQGLQDVRCIACRRTMRFLAAVADDATQGWSFAGNAWVQTLFHVCLDDGVIASYHECD